MNPLPTPDPIPNTATARERERIWKIVAHSPLASLWDLQGLSPYEIARRTLKSAVADRLFSRAAELGFYFLFSLFPTLICASTILGMVARSGTVIYSRLLEYLALVIPTTAMGAVMSTFTQTTAASTGGKLTFSLLGAIWSASVGISAIQETLNDVYKIEERRSYLVARISAIGVTLLVSALSTLCLSSMFAGDWLARHLHREFDDHAMTIASAASIRLIAWLVATSLLLLIFATIYYWAPDWRHHRWRWFTPGSAFGAIGWLVASFGFRLYLHFFDTYSMIYGSLGAVVILLMWFYISGLMLLLGGEINSIIEAVKVAEKLQVNNDRGLTHPEAA